ncbi:MAG: TlyA family RNA methyltransferase [Bdellovibrionales bacterium]|nr:TlyA family RNA methyltransferase [Bdellovibrionales bacterium]
MPKKRLDQRVLDEHLASTRTKAQALIMAGEIFVNGSVIDKSGHLVSDDAIIDYRSKKRRYVSRGGEKLEGALRSFDIDVQGLHCLDVGASTGGFTDCLLQRGAASVFAIDVGRGQLDHTLRNHPQVTWRESFHVKNITPETFERTFDLITVDVSFISLKNVLPYLVPCLKDNGLLLALIKPQFEASKKDIPKGVLKNESKRQSILRDLSLFVQGELKLREPRLSDAILKGPKGNQETFILAQKP